MSDWEMTPEEVLDLPVDELALRIFPRIAAPNSGLLNRTAFGDRAFLSNYLRVDVPSEPVRKALLEAYDWLMLHGLIMFDATQYGGWAHVTRQGQELLEDPKALTKIKAARRIDLDLHPRIAGRVRSLFILGEYESAVFLALREVEIRVRDLGNFKKSQLGIDLMRLAFSPKNGKLIDAELEGGELQATADLFAGAIGAFKNPSSHRQVDYEDVTVAAEVVLLADLLHRVLDRYEPTST